MREREREGEAEVETETEPPSHVGSLTLCCCQMGLFPMDSAGSNDHFLWSNSKDGTQHIKTYMLFLPCRINKKRLS